MFEDMRRPLEELADERAASDRALLWALVQISCRRGRPPIGPAAAFIACRASRASTNRRPQALLA
jgi:hypothetical protein